MHASQQAGWGHSRKLHVFVFNSEHNCLLRRKKNPLL